MEFLINILVIILVFMVPLIVFAIDNQWKEHFKIRYIFFSIIYLILVFILPSMIANILPFVLVIIILFKGRNEDFLRNKYSSLKFSLKEFKLKKALLYSFISYFAVIIPVSMITQIVMKTLGLSMEKQQVVQMLGDYGLLKLLIVSPALVIFAPVVEEYVFRYVLFDRILRNKLKGKFGFIISATIVSILFALVHYNAFATGMLFAISFYNCYLIENKGYWYAVFNHFVVNMITTTALIVNVFINVI